MAKQATINAGGINGLGAGLVNTNSREFRELQSMIKKAAADISEEKRLENALLSIRFQMESYLNEEQPKEIIPAGAFLKKFIEVLNIKQKDLAAYIGYEDSNLSALANGRRKINPGLAIKLGRIFKIPPAIWLHIQSKNDLIREARAQGEAYERYGLDDLLKKAG